MKIKVSKIKAGRRSHTIRPLFVLEYITYIIQELFMNARI